MDIKDQVKNVAAQGRYGDTMLLHVNPIEVEALAKTMPITVNPETTFFIVPYFTAIVPDADVEVIPPIEAFAPGSIGKNKPVSLK